MFKLIGKGGIDSCARDCLSTLGFANVMFIERPSRKGTYVSLTFELQIESAQRLDQVYTALEGLPELAYLL
ncbi:MAG: DUF493 domain-containing protein [Deltaproteobacteria bacterium]|nr:DUF493 domain-containing protein [Deltaproteobacteria bacterium]